MKAGRRGSTLVVVVSALTALVLFAGLSVDVGYWHARRASAQAVADTAVVSAIGSWDDTAGTSGTFATEKAFVEQRVRQTLSANDIDPARFTITVTKHPTRDDPVSVALDGSIDVPVFFTAVTGRTAFAVKIRSVAEASDVCGCSGGAGGYTLRAAWGLPRSWWLRGSPCRPNSCRCSGRWWAQPGW